MGEVGCRLLERQGYGVGVSLLFRSRQKDSVAQAHSRSIARIGGNLLSLSPKSPIVYV